jgi:hypothetical protein
MLRNQDVPWWRRLLLEPAYVVVDPGVERRCPECRTRYDVREHYCPDCKTAVPEWRFG